MSLGSLQPQPVAVTADTKLLTQQMRQLEKSVPSASFALTYYKMILGAQDSVTGWYRVGFLLGTLWSILIGQVIGIDAQSNGLPVIVELEFAQ